MLTLVLYQFKHIPLHKKKKLYSFFVSVLARILAGACRDSSPGLQCRVSMVIYFEKSLDSLLFSLLTLASVT